MLCDYVIAQCFLTIHHSKVVIIAVAEVGLWNNLVDRFSAFDGPNHSAAWFEPKSVNLSLVDELQRVLEAVTELLGESRILHIRDCAMSRDVLTSFLYCSELSLVGL